MHIVVDIQSFILSKSWLDIQADRRKLVEQIAKEQFKKYWWEYFRDQ